MTMVPVSEAATAAEAGMGTVSASKVVTAEVMAVKVVMMAAVATTASIANPTPMGVTGREGSITVAMGKFLANATDFSSASNILP